MRRTQLTGRMITGPPREPERPGTATCLQAPIASRRSESSALPERDERGSLSDDDVVDDTHSDVDYRMDVSLPFLSRALR